MKRKKLISQDLHFIKLIENPQLSPDGKKVIFVLKTIDPKLNNYRSVLCQIPSSGPAPVIEELTQGPADFEPRFSPDGRRIAFTRKVNDVSQLFIIERSGEEPLQITHLKGDVSDIAWSPDSEKIVFSATVYENDPNIDGEDLYQKYNKDVKVVDHIFYKCDGQGFVYNKRSQLFVAELTAHKITQLTFGEHDADSPRFAPDGKSIVFSSNPKGDCGYGLVSHICQISVLGGEPQKLTPGDVCFTKPAYSPDGKWIAYTGYNDSNNWYASWRLWIISTETGKQECLTPQSNFCVGNHSVDDLQNYTPGELPAWGRNSQSLFVTVSDAGQVYLIEVDLKSKEFKKYAQGNHVINAWHLGNDCQGAILSISDPTTPNDLWRLSFSSDQLTKLTDINTEFRKSFSFLEPESLRVTSQDGTNVEGWILKPPEMEADKKYPAILEIHGGPMAMYAWTFFFEFQLLAHEGYVVVYSNPRGSFGYGEAFTESVKWHWAERDYEDLTAILEKVLLNDFIDRNRLGVAGGSYGGFMTCHILARTDRFKAAVAMRSIINEYSRYGTSDSGFMGYLVGNDKECVPWRNPEAFLKVSPISYVENIKTPLLLLHSEQDHLCPIEQSEQLFTALKKLKREVRFIRFPDESHDLSRTGKPWHRIFRLDRILHWFDLYLKRRSKIEATIT